MIALHHWRDNTLSAFDAPHVCTTVVRHAKSAGTRTNATAAAQHSPKQKYPRDRNEPPPAKPRGMRQKRAELKLKQRLKQSTEGT